MNLVFLIVSIVWLPVFKASSKLVKFSQLLTIIRGMFGSVFRETTFLPYLRVKIPEGGVLVGFYRE